MSVIAKYKYDKSIYDNLIPEFNSGYTGYTVSDEIDGNIVTRTIECDTLPKMIRFGNFTGGVLSAEASSSLISVESLDISKVTDCASMFNSCTNLVTVNSSNWDTSNVTDMRSMFSNCLALTSPDVSNFNTEKVTAISYMFQNCQSLTSLDVSNWNTSNVISMYATFWNCQLLTSLDVSNFNTSKVTNIGSFIGKGTLSTLNLNSIIINSSNINNGRILAEQPNLDKIYINNPETLSSMLQFLPDRAGKGAGQLVTTLDLDDTTISTLSTKNWVVKTLVAQYRFDANTYEDLLPEFNPEFTSDKYEIHDSVSEIVIDDIEWESGTQNEIVSDYIACMPNVMYVYDTPVNVFWYDENKIKIGESRNGSGHPNSYPQYIVNPSGAKYLQISRNINTGYNLVISAKLITRSIESKNGDLPTLIRFGDSSSSNRDEVSAKHLSLLKINSISTSNLTSMRYMFKYCLRLIEVNCSTWDVSNVTDMQDVFQNCEVLKVIDVSNWDTSNVSIFTGVFNTCSSVPEIDVSNWDTSNGTRMHYMFQGCNVTTLDVSNFDTSKVINMNSMFAYCRNLTTLDVSNFDTSKVTDMKNMFRDCNKLTLLDVSSWDTSKVTSMQTMFYQCRYLKALNLSSWNFDSVTETIEMFYNCTRLVTLDAPNIKVPTYGENFFGEGCPVKYIRVNNLDVINTIEPQLKYARTSDNPGYIITDIAISSIPVDTISALSAKNWTVVPSSTLTKVAEYVYDSNTWRSLIPEFNSDFVDWFIDDVHSGDGKITRTISSMGGLPTMMRFGQVFINNETDYKNDERCASLLEVLAMNTSMLNTTRAMFRRCSRVIRVDCNWETSNVNYLTAMFENCVSLSELDVSRINTSKVLTIDYMFCGCSKLTSLDVSNFDTSNVTNMRAMFYGCSKLTSLDLSNWNTSKVTDMNLILTDTSSLTDIGMVYCSPSTVNTLVSQLDTQPRNIYVEEDPLTYDQYNNITYKRQVRRDYFLTSPLLEGDRLEEIDGKVYHYHKMGKVVLDGSEDENWHGDSGVSSARTWRFYPTPDSQFDSYMKSNPNSLVYSDDLPYVHYDYLYKNEMRGVSVSHNGNINIRNMISSSVQDFKQWLQTNPITVIYELANPYYELVSEEPLSLPSVDNGQVSTISTITPSSIALTGPTFSLSYLESNSLYTIQFDVDKAGTIDAIKIGDITLPSMQVYSGSNKVQFTTGENPSSYITFLGEPITITRLQVVKTDKPFSYFEGLKSSYEDFYIPDNLAVGESSQFPINISNTQGFSSTTTALKPNTEYTFILKVSNATDGNIFISIDGGDTFSYSLPCKDGYRAVRVITKDNFVQVQIKHSTSTCTLDSLVILEGNFLEFPAEVVANNINKYITSTVVRNAPYTFCKRGRI